MQYLEDQQSAIKKAIQNHTKHITDVKKDLQTKAKQRQLEELVAQMKRFALNAELKGLYDKVVPPVDALDKQVQFCMTSVATFKEMLGKIDENLCIRATKQDVLNVDNKFRFCVKKDKYNPFKETTELEYIEMKNDVNNVVKVVNNIEKKIEADIKKAVKRATDHLKPDPITAEKEQ